jgi:AraC-like DNA-binding protein
VQDLQPKRLSATPTTSGVATRLACERAQAAGIEVEPLLKKAGLTKQQVDDVDPRLNVECEIRFLNLAASALRDEYLGFHLGQEAELRKYGLIYYAAASSETLGETLERVARYVSIVNEGLSIKFLKGKNIRMVINYVGVARHLDQHQIECWLTVLIRTWRKVTGYPVGPTHVSLTHRRRGNFSKFAAFLGCNIEFGAAVDEVIFPPSMAEIPIVSADPYLNKLLIAKFEEAHSPRPTTRGSFRSVVENAIAPLLPHGNARESEIARRCGLSRRTFVRRLMSEGLTFSRVLNSLRRDLAAQYLADHALSISQVAWLLGYQKVSAFTNAFKHWTGKTPREARSRRQSSALSYPLIESGPNGHAFVYAPKHASVDRIASGCIKSLGIIAEAITKTHPSGEGCLAERERLPVKAVDKGNTLPAPNGSSLPHSRDSR